MTTCLVQLPRISFNRGEGSSPSHDYTQDPATRESFVQRQKVSIQRLPLIMPILLINPSAPQAISKLKKMSLELLVSTAGRLPKALMTRLQQTLHLIVNHAAQRG